MLLVNYFRKAHYQTVQNRLVQNVDEQGFSADSGE
jgi:hypothetical protein